MSSERKSPIRDFYQKLTRAESSPEQNAISLLSKK
jgi:hypothetical protein